MENKKLVCENCPKEVEVDAASGEKITIEVDGGVVQTFLYANGWTSGAESCVDLCGECGGKEACGNEYAKGWHESVEGLELFKISSK